MRDEVTEGDVTVTVRGVIGHHFLNDPNDFIVLDLVKFTTQGACQEVLVGQTGLRPMSLPFLGMPRCGTAAEPGREREREGDLALVCALHASNRLQNQSHKRLHIWIPPRFVLQPGLMDINYGQKMRRPL